MNVGRSGSPLDQIGDQLRTVTTGVTLSPSVSYDASALQERVQQIVSTAQVTPVDATISFKNGEYVVTPAADGQQVNGDEVLRQAIAALNTDSIADASIDVPATAVSAAISTPDAQAAVSNASGGDGRAPDARHRRRPHTRSMRRRCAAGFSSTNSSPGQWSVVVDRAPIDQLVGVLKTQVDQPAVEADFQFQRRRSNGRSRARPATRLTRPARQTRSTTRSRPRYGHADRRDNAARRHDRAGVHDRGSAGARRARSSCWARGRPSTSRARINGDGQNIRRPADLINGTVVQPGGVFDFVGVAGPITEANGYSDGAAIIHGKTKAEGVLGGGLCSASTTAVQRGVAGGLRARSAPQPRVLHHALPGRPRRHDLDQRQLHADACRSRTTASTRSSIRGLNKKRSVTFESLGRVRRPHGHPVDARVTNTRKADELLRVHRHVAGARDIADRVPRGWLRLGRDPDGARRRRQHHSPGHDPSLTDGSTGSSSSAATRAIRLRARSGRSARASRRRRARW